MNNESRIEHGTLVTKWCPWQRRAINNEQISGSRNRDTELWNDGMLGERNAVIV